MPEQLPQVSTLAGELVKHQRYLEALPSDDRQWAIQNTVAAIALFVEAVKNRAATVAKKLLEFLFSFHAEAVKEFIAKKNFVEGSTINGVSIAWLGSNFKTNFLGKTEKNVEAAELKVSKLLEAARDLPKDDEPGIISELTGKHEAFLAHFHQLLAHKQRTKDFTWVIAYICDENGNLWAVRAGWDSDDGGWRVGARPLVDPDGWRAGGQVVSR